MSEVRATGRPGGLRHGPTGGETADDIKRERRIVELLDRAFELEGAARRRFLDRACRGDPTLRAEVGAMLDEDQEATDEFLETPALARLDHEPTQALDAAALPRAPSPQRLGPYRILGRLGRGGMGTVYLGEQEEPVRRRVALKVLDAIHDRRLLQRFAAECQALARLQHPNVASLYEVGTTAGEHPYVAMEPVDGTAITEWCDERRLSLKQRIELFLGVCAGVRHAHEKGILHRDLKPGNILVTEVDGRPTAKVIDFGIARALGEPLHSGSRPMTLDHQIVGSPAYMCPELVAGEREVDTRSDVYALGLVLYELLIGVPPFELKVAVGALLRRILMEEPPAPGARYAELDSEHRQQIAADRSLASPRRLSRRIRGDLDAIVTKTLARDPEQRYSSPADLANDLERHLEMRPVEARASSARYRMGRFILRHRAMVAAAVLAVTALVIGIVGTAREARRANLEAARANLEAERAREAQAEAQRVSQFLVDLFEIADPERGRDEPVDVRQLLDRGAERLQTELQDQPLARALFLHTIGELYTKMALFEPATRLVAEALAIRERELPTSHPEVLESVNQLGVVYRRQKRLEDAEPLLRRVLASREAAPEPEPVAIALALNNLGNLLWSQERYEEAEAVHRRALAIRERELEPRHPDLAETLNNLGALFQAQERFEEARPVLQRAAEIYAEATGTEHPRYAATLFNLSLIQEALGEWQQAEDHCRQASQVWEAAYGAAHPRTHQARSRLALLLRRQGRYEESIPIYREMLRVRQEALGPDDPKIPGLLRRLAMAQTEVGDFDSAEALFQRALAMYLESRGEDHRSTLNARSNLAWLAWRRGDHAESEAAHRRLLEARRRLLGPEHAATASTLHHLALATADQGRDSEAEPLLRRALEIREASLGEGHRRVADTRFELGRLAQRAGRSAEARRLFEQALEVRRRLLPPDHHDLRRVAEALASAGAAGDS